MELVKASAGARLSRRTALKLGIAGVAGSEMALVESLAWTPRRLAMAADRFRHIGCEACSVRPRHSHPQAISKDSGGGAVRVPGLASVLAQVIDRLAQRIPDISSHPASVISRSRHRSSALESRNAVRRPPTARSVA